MRAEECCRNQTFGQRGTRLGERAHSASQAWLASSVPTAAGYVRVERAATSPAYAAQSPLLACCHCTATERCIPSMRARIAAESSAPAPSSDRPQSQGSPSGEKPEERPPAHTLSTYLLGLNPATVHRVLPRR